MSFEVRRYDGAKYAVVSSEGRSFDQVTGELVRKLLMYIGGSNEQGRPHGGKHDFAEVTELIRIRDGIDLCLHSHFAVQIIAAVEAVRLEAA